MKALANLARDVAAQFKRRGDLLKRLACVLGYWAVYTAGRLRGMTRVDARLSALDVLADLGSTQRTATVRWDGFTAEFDVFSACFLTIEILDDGVYRRPGFQPHPGGTVLDVGAHQGLFSLQAARAVGPSGRVLAIEPFPYNRALLERNLAANGLTWVSVVAAAADEREGESGLNVARRVTGGQSLVFASDAGASVPVKTVTLDELLASRGIKAVDLLKIDVEGAWRRVFAGATKLLASRPRIVMEVEGGDAELEAAAVRLRELGYTTECAGSMVYALPRGK